MRPIDGDSAVQQIREFAECKKGCSENFYYGRGCNACAFGKIIKIVENAPTIEPYGTWIPCSERLPEYGRCFKVWASFSNQYASYTKRIHWDYDRFVWNNGREVKEMPDAWMPYFSPEPYREEKDDRD